MSLFTSSYNLESGTFEWIKQDMEYDYKQEIARSGYADMLWDQERNDKYYKAIKICVDHMRKNNKEIHVLDIGTGTGLLSMMAASCQVDSITACEAFYPMYNCANRILSDNFYREKIKLIPKRSTELKVGPGQDMKRRANLLIAELLDTELIGEGAIGAYIHAKEHLLEKDALLVPTSATVYAQIVSSESILNWNKLKDLKYKHGNENVIISIPKQIKSCRGYEFHDIQMSELSESEFEPLTHPVPVCKLDWTGRNVPLTEHYRNVSKLNLIKNGTCDAVFMWWEIEMQSITHDILSCAPYWAHPLTKDQKAKSSKDIPWRDHWMQAVYFLPNTPLTDINEDLCLITYHDSHSFWFDIAKSIKEAPKMTKPMCDCYLHLTISGNRLAQLSNREYINFFSKILNEHITSSSVCLFIGDLCLHAIYAIKIGAKHVYLTKLPIHTEILQEIIDANNMKDQITILPDFDLLSEEIISQPIDLVFGEPYFGMSFLSWENLKFYKLKEKVKRFCSPSVKILPDKFKIKCIPVQFRDLWKIHSPVTSTCGFNISHFDEIIVEARQVDENVEPKPVWEYPCLPLGPEISIMELNMTLPLPSEDKIVKSKVKVNRTGVLNGIVLWAEWHFENECYSTGAINYTEDKIEWNPFVKQGVYFVDHPKNVDQNDEFIYTLSTKFDPKNCACCFDINEPIQ